MVGGALKKTEEETRTVHGEKGMQLKVTAPFI
jgi:hypothetical protein